VGIRDGLNLDFTVFSFQVPMLLSAVFAMAPNAKTMLAAHASATLARFVILPPFFRESS
jgi:hypothetical protein